MIVVFMSESKIRQNTKDNMTIVMRQFDVYLGNYIANMFHGFKNFESNQNLMQLREVSRKKSSLSYTAGNYIYVKKLQEQFLNANSASVHNVYINFGDGRVWTQAYEQDLLKIQYTYDTWKERFPENRYYWVDADSCRDLIPDPAVGAVLFHLYGGTENSYSGIILIAIRKEFFKNILDTTSLDQKASLNIVTEGGIMHFGNENAWEVVEKNREYLLNCTVKKDGVNTEVLDGYYFMYEDIDLTGWKLVYNVDESSISNTHYIMRDMMLITVFTIVAAGLFLGWLSKAVSYSLRELTKKVEAKDMLEHEISVHSYAEITTLSNSLEDMRLRINHLLNQVKQEQDSKRQAEIALLQEQIHPHFLYNTLYMKTVFKATAVAEIWRGIPFFAITLLAALQNIPADLHEACVVDGATAMQEIFLVKLPMLKDTIILTTLLRGVWEFNNVDLIFTLTGGGPSYRTTTLTMYMTNMSVKNGNYGYGSTLAVIAFFILLLFAGIYLKLSGYGKEEA